LSTQIRFRRGLVSALPTGADGEPLYATDTNTLYMGNGTATPDRVLMAGTGIITNADINASAAITRSKLATGTASHVVIHDGSGNLSSEAALAISRGGTNNGSLAVTAGGVVYTDGTKLVNVGAGTSGQVLTSAGASAPTWATASTGHTYVVKASDETTSLDDVLSADSTLSIALSWGNNSNYVVKGTIFVSCANASADIAYQWNGPSTAGGTGFVSIYSMVQRVGNATVTLVAQDTAFATGGTGGNTPDLNLTTVHVINFSGVFRTGTTAGSQAFVFEWAQGTSNASVTTVHKGSWMSVGLVS